jgi:hypothetical protein
LGNGSDSPIPAEDFTTTNGEQWRLLFEARSHRNPLKQSAVFAFDGVVRDIAALTERQCAGVMVTTTGYQKGAQTVGESLHVVLLELRVPTEADTARRAMQIKMTAVARTPVIQEVHVEIAEDPPESRLGGWMEIEYTDGTRRGLGDVLVEGGACAIGRTGDAAPQGGKAFADGERLLKDGEPVGTLRLVSAKVGQAEGAFDFVIGGLGLVAWVLMNSITGSRVVRRWQLSSLVHRPMTSSMSSMH